MNLRNIIAWAIIIGIVGLGIYLLWYINTESFKCMSNPYIYSIKLLEKANNAEVICVCSANKLNAVSVLLTRNGFENMKIESIQTAVPKLNFSFLLPEQ
jgi:hypothetical protein